MARSAPDALLLWNGTAFIDDVKSINPGQSIISIVDARALAYANVQARRLSGARTVTIEIYYDPAGTTGRAATAMDFSALRKVGSVSAARSTLLTFGPNLAIAVQAGRPAPGITIEDTGAIR